MQQSLPDLLAIAKDLGFQGLNITHPHKQAIVPLLDEVDPVAQALGAVNTVVIRDGHAKGFNTDVTGYRRSLPQDMVGKEVVQVGAGGAGNAVAYALVTAGVQTLSIADLDESRAQQLADNINRETGTNVVQGIALDGVEDLIARAYGVVNATPMGMPAHPGTSFDTACLSPQHWVSDVVYMPVETQLLKEARALGCATLDGTGMAVGQAVDAFRLFTGRIADEGRMRQAFVAAG